ncbi:unnamed protein product [Anisakis simplex]|uniref:Uncharacterized protein n=1 Tax=Anisakis simplex TaxID=6269 RepID=A0A3P6PKJ9_ANISI|nr:unnamed protein product [Anisakis simplex]
MSTEWSFSVEMGSKVRSSFMTIIGGLSSTINSDRFVCLHPVGNTYGEICNWLRYESKSLKADNHQAHRWYVGIGECPGCNERGVDNFLQKLDPREWMNGLNSTTEIVTCILEITLVITAILITILIITKCLIPLIKFFICFTKPYKK